MGNEVVQMFFQLRQCFFFWLFEAPRLNFNHFIINFLFAVCVEAKVEDISQEDHSGKPVQQLSSEGMIIVVETFVKLVSDDVGYWS